MDVILNSVTIDGAVAEYGGVILLDLAKSLTIDSGTFINLSSYVGAFMYAYSDL